MKIKCDYCGSIIEEQNENCPNCGATLNGVNRFAKEQPQTIEELKEWYIARNLPPEEVTRFFIGKNITDARAFGIYRDSAGDYIVYKNKADGTRSVRYQGTDEAYAVNELYQKLKSEIAERKNRSASRQYSEREENSTGKKKANTRNKLTGIYCGCIFAVALCGAVMANRDKAPSRGYYQYDDSTYYHQNSSWYYYDEDSDDWNVLEDDAVPEELYSDDDGEYLTNQHDGKSFEDSIWYVEDSYDDYDDDWDNDYDWDSGSDWDSGGTDWDSDW